LILCTLPALGVKNTPPGTPPPSRPFPSGPNPKENPMRGILAWLIGIPIPIIILYFLDVF
jgi:hypothetical protein